MASVGSSLSPSSKAGRRRSMFSDQVTLSQITSNSSLGDDKPVFYSIRAYISFIKPDQTMWYCACKTCNKKITDSVRGGYWCESCQKNDDECSLRYIMVVEISDATGEEGWVSAFNDGAEKIISCSADDLDKLKSSFTLSESICIRYNLRCSLNVSGSCHLLAETKFLLEEISKIKGFQYVDFGIGFSTIYLEISANLTLLSSG